MKKTKIIATVGPACWDESKLISLSKAGVNILRFNFSHAQYEQVRHTCEIIKKLNKQGKTNFSLLLDTKGPEIRTGDVNQAIVYKKGDKFKLSSKKINESQALVCNYPDIVSDMQKGDKIIIDSGQLTVEVMSKTKDYLLVKALENASISSKRHINLPGIKLNLPGITSKDKQDILFGIEVGFDFIAASFVRNKANLVQLKNFLKKHGGEDIKIISKIENQEALENLEDIVINSDGVMVARGDLGVEIPIPKLPFYQKQIMNKCFEYGKIIILATEFLKSMVSSPFPTRAEVSDIYNAVVLRSDCIMLSDETAVGAHPIKSAQMMSKVCIEAEQHINNKHKPFFTPALSDYTHDKKHIVRYALFLSEEVQAQAVLLFTQTGFLASMASAYKPNLPVYAFTVPDKSVKYMNMLYGIKPYQLKSRSLKHEQDEEMALNFLKENKLQKKGDKIVLVTDVHKGQVNIPVIKIMNID